MCGIAGHIWKEEHRPASSEFIERMCAVQSHRGPDDQGTWLEGPIALGHRRLSILDLSAAGHQPMVSNDGQFVIAFNGEIYNYVELRDQLKQHGCDFETQTDTEVILQAYRVWGEDCVTRFNGMWAFAIVDRRKRQVFISRDRFGIKPFYYVNDEHAFVFASEIKGILSVCPEHRKPHAAYLARFLPTGMLDDGEETCFAQVRSLPAAHNAVYNLATGKLRTYRYWAVEPEEFRSRWHSTDPIGTLRELLRSAVQIHLRSDVPVGTCLSGGLDSSTLVALMSQFHSEPVRTFSGLYEDKDCNEQQYVQSVNGHVATIPYPVRPEPKGDLLDDLTKITWHQDEPTAGAGLYTQYHVMRTVSSAVKVVLDGQGGDELFAGYLWFFRPYFQDLLARRTPLGWLKAARLVSSVWWHWGPRMLPDGVKLFGNAIYNRVRRFVHKKATSPLVVNPTEILSKTLQNQAEIKRQFEKKFETTLEQTLHEQVMNTSIPALLHYEDRNSMAFSIEARVPYLDYRLVELAFALDVRQKIRGTWTKWILRKAASEVLPKSVAWRRSKMGYPTPLARWLRQDSEKDLITDVLFSRQLRERELLNPTAVEQLWKEHQQGTDHSWMIYRILTLELWHRHYIDEFLPCPAVIPPTVDRSAA